MEIKVYQAIKNLEIAEKGLTILDLDKRVPLLGYKQMANMTDMGIMFLLGQLKKSGFQLNRTTKDDPTKILLYNLKTEEQILIEFPHMVEKVVMQDEFFDNTVWR